MKTQAEPLLMAEVQTTALMIDGNTETPERVKAMTKGDCWAVPVEMLSDGSLDGLDFHQKDPQVAFFRRYELLTRSFPRSKC